MALVARGKPLEIVTNTASKRKTEMAVNFDRGERNFGSDAYALVSRKPKQTFTKITTMLGRRFCRNSTGDALSFCCSAAKAVLFRAGPVKERMSLLILLGDCAGSLNCSCSTLWLALLSSLL